MGRVAAVAGLRSRGHLGQWRTVSRGMQVQIRRARGRRERRPGHGDGSPQGRGAGARRPGGTALRSSSVAAGCTSGTEPPAGSPRPSRRPRPPRRTKRVAPLTFGVFGPAGRRSTPSGASSTPTTPTPTTATVKVRAWPSHDDLLAAAPGRREVPDVFLVSRERPRRGCGTQELTQPVDDLLDERGVDFGDGYSRDALAGLQRRQPAAVHALRHLADGHLLQQASSSTSPEMAGAGSTRPNVGGAAHQAAAGPSTSSPNAAGVRRPGRAAGTRGRLRRPRRCAASRRSSTPAAARSSTTTVEPDLAGVLRRRHAESALERTLPLLRDPHAHAHRPSSCEQATPLEWFERGRLGMIAGFRSLVPELRDVPGLDFDVMPMPVAGQLRHRRRHHRPVPLAAGRRARRRPPTSWSTPLSTPSVAPVARAGLPRPGQPRGRALRRLPAAGPRSPSTRRCSTPRCARCGSRRCSDYGPALEAAVAPDLRELVDGAGPRRPRRRSRSEIDAASRTVLAPASAEPESPQ